MKNLSASLLIAAVCASASLYSAADTETTAAATTTAATEQGALSSEASAAPSANRPAGVPPVVHSHVGDVSKGTTDGIKLVNIGKKQQFSSADKSAFDSDIFSPKSVTFSTDGSKFYVNSLEGCQTVVYDTKSMRKLKTIKHKFNSGKGDLWATPAGYYSFTHYPNGESRAFQGKPVESAWSHNGRYLWVPYYRRTFDINAQDPSAIAVIDSQTDEIIRMFETGPLPKMVATSPDNKLLAITHWGNNTVGLMDISSADPKQWKHLPPVTVGHKLNLNYPLDCSVNRDSNSGFLLRGTVFTPDSRYLIVSGMAGPLAVIDPHSGKHLGMVENIHGVRHLAIRDGWVYGSRNSAGEAIKFSLDSLISAIDRAQAAGIRNMNVKGVTTVKVGGGARTLDVSPDGKFLYVACNSGNAIYVVDAAAMKVVDNIRCDSYPVGLALSDDGRLLISTSQGRKGYGGNAVNIYRVERPDLPDIVKPAEADSTKSAGAPLGGAADDSGNASAATGNDTADMGNPVWNYWLMIPALLLATGFIMLRRRKA